jgi:SAM-dependent methyltransferase
MKTKQLKHFQTDGDTWEKRAEKGKLPSVIDPGDLKGRKNYYIDLLQKMVIQRALGKGKKQIILDFGCGSGRFTDLLAQHCGFLVGTEITYEMLDMAKDENRAPNVGFVLFDGLHLPMKDQTVDLLVSVNVLQYITDDSELHKVLSELRRTLATGGRFLCIEQVTKNKKRWQRKLQSYLDYFEQNDFKKLADYPIRKGHFLLLYPIYLGLLPKTLLRTVARFEIPLRKILWHSTWDYQDHFFELVKK